VFPELHGKTQVEMEPTKFYLPTKMPIVTNAQIQKLQQIMPSELQELDDIHSKTSGLQRTFDVDSLLQLQHVSSRQDY
jgi:hypothetical protein